MPQPVGPSSRMLDLASSTRRPGVLGSPPFRRPGRACSGCRPRPRGPSSRGPGRRRTLKELVDLARLGQLVPPHLGGLGELLLDDLVAEVDALVADVDAGACDELLHLLLALSAERALEQVAAVTDACHGWRLPSISAGRGPLRVTTGTARDLSPDGRQVLRPYSVFALCGPGHGDAPRRYRPAPTRQRLARLDDLVDQAVVERPPAVRILSRSMSCGPPRASCRSARPHLLQLRAHPEDLVGRDLDVAGLAAGALVDGWWIRIGQFGSAIRLPGVPAARMTAAAEAAWPMQTVWMSGLMNCIVS